VLKHHAANAMNKIPNAMAKPLCCARKEGGVYSGSSRRSSLGNMARGAVGLESTIFGAAGLGNSDLGSIDHHRLERAASVAARPPLKT